MNKPSSYDGPYSPLIEFETSHVKYKAWKPRNWTGRYKFSQVWNKLKHTKKYLKSGRFIEKIEDQI